MKTRSHLTIACLLAGATSACASAPTLTVPLSPAEAEQLMEAAEQRRADIFTIVSSVGAPKKTQASILAVSPDGTTLLLGTNSGGRSRLPVAQVQRVTFPRSRGKLAAISAAAGFAAGYFFGYGLGYGNSDAGLRFGLISGGILGGIQLLFGDGDPPTFRFSPDSSDPWELAPAKPEFPERGRAPRR